MGVDHHAYIGPYVRVTQVVEKKTIDKCADHDFPADASFCPKCGRAKGIRLYTVEGINAPDDWEEDYKQGTFCDYLTSTSFMSPPDVEVVNGKRQRTHLYIPNRYFKELGLPHIDGGKYSEEEVPLDELDVREIVEKFKQLFADELGYLRQWFEVEVKFGYVGYCS